MMETEGVMSVHDFDVRCVYVCVCLLTLARHARTLLSSQHDITLDWILNVLDVV